VNAPEEMNTVGSAQRFRIALGVVAKFMFFTRPHIWGLELGLSRKCCFWNLFQTRTINIQNSRWFEMWHYIHRAV